MRNNPAYLKQFFYLRRILPVVMLLLAFNWLKADTQVPAGNVSGVWPVNGSPYVLNGTVTIPAGMTLTIQPGVIVQFPRSNYNLIIKGSLNAVGTVSDSIRFLGVYSNIYSNYGGTVYFDSTSNNSILSYLHVEKLGDNYSNGDAGQFNIVSPTKPTINNSFFTTTESSSDISTWMGGMDNSNNINGVIGIRGEPVTVDGTMPKQAVNSYYKMLGTATINSGVTVTMKPGVTLKFPYSSYNLVINGSLNAVGTISDSIRFLGVYSNIYSNYGGTVYFNATSTSSVLSYLHVEKLGDTYSNGDEGQFNIISPAKPTITNSYFTTTESSSDISTWMGGMEITNNIYGVIGFRNSIVNLNSIVPKQATGGYYKMLGTVTINSGTTVTIKPGVDIRFPYSSYNLIVNGSLNAVGIASDSIRFLGVYNNIYSNYGGTVYFNANSTGSVLSYMHVEGLGDTYSNGDEGQFNIVSPAKPTITNSYFTTTESSSNISTWMGGMENSNNINGVIGIRGELVTVNGTMPKQSVDGYYKMLGTVTINSDVTITMKPGVVLKFPYSGYNLVVNGSLNAIGTAVDSIRFLGIYNNVYSNYGGTVYFDSASTGTVLSYLHVEKLGDTYSNGDDGQFNIISPAKPTITNSYFTTTESSSDISTWIGGMENTNNINGAIGFRSSTVNLNSIVPRQATGGYYKMLGAITINSGVRVTIKPGVEVRFPYSSYNLIVNGSLNAIGTISDSIRFLGVYSNIYSNYGGTVYFNATSTSSVLSYLHVEKLGDTYSNGDEGQFNIISPAKPTITNSYFTTTESSSDVSTWMGGMENTNNVNAVIGIRSGIVDVNSTLPKQVANVYYRMLGNITVNNGITVTILPGASIDFYSSTNNLVFNGTLRAIGTASDPVQFLKVNGSGSYGGSIILSSASSNSVLNFVNINKLGSTSNNSRALEIQTSNVTVANINVTNNQSSGLYISNNASPTIAASTISNNGTGAYVTSGKPVFSNCNILNNGFGINNVSSVATDIVDARTCFWGSVTGPKHPTLNPNGTGNQVSDKVLFNPVNVQVQNGQVTDVGVSKLLSPITGCGLSNSETITVQISNYGNTVQTGFTVGYRVDNNTFVLENIGSASLLTGSAVNYSFTQKANFSIPGNHTIKIFTSLSSDSTKSNDTTTAIINNVGTLAKPANLLPVNNSVGLTKPIRFSWSAVANAAAYDFYLWKTSDAVPNSPLAANLSQINFTYSGSVLEYGKAYRWKVVARSNNCSTSSDTLSFTLRALPDVIIDSIFTPSTAYSETPITFWWKTKNKGTANTNTNWTETYYWTSSQIILNNSFNEGAGSHLIGTVNNITALNAGQSYRSSDFNFTIPVGAQGTYYILVKTNSANSLQEDSTANNITISKPITVTLSPSPDLQVTSLITTPASSIFADSTLFVTYTVKNTDSGRTNNATWTDKIYFSNSPIFDVYNATLLATRNHQGVLQYNESYTISNVPVQIPSHIYGSYYVHVVTDANDQVFENVRNDNNIKASNPITVFLNPAPNLVVTKVAIPADTVTNRQPIAVQWTELNKGAISTYANWVTSFYLSTDTVLNFQSDIPIGNYNYTTVLNSLDSASRDYNTEIPANVPEGKYYCFAYTDATDRIFEATDALHSGENDNAKRSSGQITVINPDLKPDKPFATDTAFSEQTVNVSLLVNNVSRANIFNASWKDKVYISTDSLFSSNDTLLTTLPNTTFVVANGSYSRQQDIIIPRGMSGKHYLIVIADADNELTEKSETNNIASQSIFIKLSPYADLQVVSPSPARVVNDTAGTGFAATYSVSNRGKKSITNGEWDDYLFLSPTKNGTETNLVFIGSVHQQRTLDTAATYTQQASFILSPSLLAGRYYLLVATDYNNAIYENVAEANNKGFGDTINIAPLPFVDLAVDSATISQTSITAGNPLSIRYKVSNPGTTPLLVPSWQDAVYLSNNTTLDASDRLLSEWKITRAMNPGDSYTAIRQITIPPDVSGPLYLLLVTDKDNSVNDITRNNNTKWVAFSVNGIPQDTVIITVVQPPPADLVIDSLIAPAEGTESQPTTMRFTVSNKGPGTTQSRHWIDKLYLSTDFSLSSDDIVIGSVPHNDSLAAGRSYTDTVPITLPRNITGNYIVIVKADANNNVYERGREDNNTGFAGILIKAQDSCDLINTNIIVPADTAIAGKPLTIQWKIKNIGSNAANGYTKEGAYISTDSIWDSGDVLLGYAEGTINLAPLGDTTRSLTATIVNTPPGRYYILVRTDVLDNLKEQNENNNTGSSSSPLNIKIKTLPFYISTTDTLQDNVPLYYQLSVPPAYVGETAQLTLAGDSLHNAINRIYLSRDTLPNQNQYNFAGQEPFKANQQILVPALQSGTYYITAYGSSNTASGRQPVTLLAKTIPFSILSVQTNHGGNTGYVTVKLTGAKFEPGMKVRLTGTTTILALNVQFVNSTVAFATFNLNGTPMGLYTVSATNAASQTAQMMDGFTIEPASPGGTGLNGSGFTCSIQNVGYENNLTIRKLYPLYTGNNTTVVITVNYKNNSNVDLPLPQRVLFSETAPINSSPDFSDSTIRSLPLEFAETPGPANILRAGAEGSVKVYMRAYGPPHTKLYFYLNEE